VVVVCALAVEIERPASATITNRAVTIRRMTGR
jgi:hypothetical protein